MYFRFFHRCRKNFTVANEFYMLSLPGNFLFWEKEGVQFRRQKQITIYCTDDIRPEWKRHNVTHGSQTLGYIVPFTNLSWACLQKDRILRITGPICVCISITYCMKFNMNQCIYADI